MAGIEPAQEENVADVRRISGQVFAAYGGYGNLLPQFVSTPGVTSYVARVGSRVVGFVCVGFLPWGKGDAQTDPWVGEVLGIAVEPERQRQGIGQQLMQQVFDLVEQMREWRDVREIQLTCAEDNSGAIRFFGRYGFTVSEAHHESFSSGQAAVRLVLKLSPG